MRSVNKGPYIDSSLLRKIKKHIATNNKGAIKTKSRRSTIIADFIGLAFDVYNGKRYHLVTINSSMLGHKLGEFSPTRTFVKHSGSKSNLIVKRKIKK